MTGLMQSCGYHPSSGVSKQEIIMVVFFFLFNQIRVGNEDIVFNFLFATQGLIVAGLTYEYTQLWLT